MDRTQIAPEPNMLDAVNAGVEQGRDVELTPEEADKRRQEEAKLKKLWKEYEDARKFDRFARRQYAIDRRYASGSADKRFAVSTNLIGSFIDILVSFLYARNPDVSVKKAPQVNDVGTAGLEDFAKTVEIVVSKLWKQGRLKDAARRMVRSGLSVGVGWLKVILICDGTNIPEMNEKLADARDNLRRMEAIKAKLGDPEAYGVVEDGDWGQMDQCSPEDIDAARDDLEKLTVDLQRQVEVAIMKSLAIDFVSAECMQVSLDVRNITDYRNGNWVSNDIYRTMDEAEEMFPRVKDELKSAKQYYQKRAMTQNIDMDVVALQDNVSQQIDADDADQYTSGTSSSGQVGEESGPAFVKITELWDRRTNHVYTMIDGLKRWAKEPYQPDYPASRFFPYFLVSFYDVDGERHPQSLSGRLSKLQDEYSISRSSFRLMRQRATPGIIFNATGLTEEDMQKIKNSTEQEFVGIKPVMPDTPLQNLFAPKPYERVDPRMYDNTPILTDMEKVAGVQEALQSSSNPEKTATEAQIQQTGFASRTTADRDALEEVLSELAQYCAQLSIEGLDTKQVQRMAGPGALWPEGMALDDLHTMVELDIVAGTTGKPKAMGDREAWGVLLPQIKEAIMQIQQAIITNNLPLAEALKELLRETMLRMGDDTDIDRFIPAIPEAPQVPGMVDPATGLPMPPAPGVAGAGATGDLPPGPDRKSVV